jgi:hypothetical protein
MFGVIRAFRERAATARDNPGLAKIKVMVGAARLAGGGSDIARVEILQDVVRDWLDQIADVGELEHPEARWHPDDLRASLHGALMDLAAERDRCRYPLALVE